MRRASSYFWRVLPLIVIVFSFAAILLFGEEANKTPLEALLAGTSRDGASVLSSIEERDLPLALAAAEILKFRAVHGDIPFSPKEADDFHSAVSSRLQNAGTVSLKKTDVCSTPVPERVVELAGQKITIPAHYIAEQPLIILDSAPKDEAGTLLPDLQVFYRSAQPLSKYVFTLDGKPLTPLSVSRETLSYRPPVSLTNILAIGTHTAEVRLWDSAGHEVGKKWSFTVGLKPVPCSSIPTNAAKVGSFSTTIESLFPDSPIKGTLLIKVFESADGKRFFEYSVFDPKRGTREMMTTPSLFSLQKFLRTGAKRDAIRIEPPTQYCFPGTTFTLSVVFSGDDNGKIKSQHWDVIRGAGEILYSCDDPQLTWTVKEDVEIEVSAVVEYMNPDGTSYSIRYTANSFIHVFIISSNIGLIFPNLLLSDTGYESVPFSVPATRQIMDVGPNGYYFRDLVEGQTIPFPSGWEDHGTLTVVRSRLKIIAGDGKVEIENPTAGQAKLLFKKYGYVEYVNDISLTYDYRNQHDSRDLPCSDSALFGVYPYKAVAKFEKTPPGIIRDTSRLFRLKEVDISINGIPGKATTQDGISCPITPPIQLAKSSTYPNTTPLVADSLFPILTRKEANGLSQLPQFENFQTTLAYDDETYVEHGGIPCRAYFIAYSAMNPKRDPIDWDLFTRYARPMSNWFSVEAFPNPASLVTLEMTPPPSEIMEGQEAKIPVTIFPLPGKGTGQITNTGGQINLLDGYETQRLEEFSWTARLLSPTTPKGTPRAGNLEIKFKPDQGTGTYEIGASATLTVKEDETGSIGKVFGTGSTTVLVHPSLKITSPAEGEAFPIGFPIKISTNKDGTNEWKNIQWSISPSSSFPQPTGGPWQFTTNEAKSWTLTAKLQVGNNQEVTSVVTFSTKKVDISISPARKISVLSGPTPVEVGVSVAIDGKQVERPSTTVPWGTDGSTARVLFGWEKVVAESTGNTFTPTIDSFSGRALFSSKGAMTIIASVSVEVIPKSGGRVPIYFFPNVRADLWAFAQPAWAPLNSTLPDGNFPHEAIAPAGRTFNIKDGTISFAGKQYSWNSQTGLNDSIEFPPAMPSSDILPVKVKTIRFVWSSPNNQPSNTFSFVPTFRNPGTAFVKLQSFLEFTEGVEISFEEKNFSITVFDINALVAYQINPNSFNMSIGEIQLFSFQMAPIPTVKNNSNSDFLLLGGVYKLTLDQVKWYNHHSNANSQVEICNEYSFKPSDFGEYKIVCLANYNLSEQTVRSKNAYWPITFDSECNGNVNYPKVEFEFQYNDWTKIYGCSSLPDDSISLLIKLSSPLSLADLVRLNFPLRIHSSSSLPTGYLDCGFKQADYKFDTGSNDIMVVYKPATLRNLGLIPASENDSENEFCSCDNALETPDTSNHTDSDEFDSQMSSMGYTTRGKARDNGNYSLRIAKANSDFVKHAGAQTIWFSAWNSQSEERLIRDQADWFYWSGHGHHKDGHLVTLDKETQPSDVNWNGDLDVAIISGCSILDIKDYRAKSFGTVAYAEWVAAGGDWSPGSLWEQTGPKYLVGNCWAGPSDISGTKEMVRTFLTQVASGKTIPEAWSIASPVTKGPNACVIDCSKEPHEYWYWDETSGSPVWTKIEKGVSGW